MNQIQLTNWDATKMGFLLSAGVTVLALILRPDSWSFTIFGVNALIIVFVFGITGALCGRLFTRTRKGTWLGAGMTLFLLFSWLFAIASKVSLD